MSVYSEFSFYSPMLDSTCIRISVADSQGSEFFTIIPSVSPGRGLREAREKALAAIESAIESGLTPGEVNID